MRTSPAGAALRAAGATVNQVATAADLSARPLGNGGTSGSNHVTAVLTGFKGLTPRVEQAIRDLVPQRVADEVCRLATEAYGARHV